MFPNLYTGEGNVNLLQYSCLENPVDRGAWWAAVYGVAQSQTRLKQLSMDACIGEGNGNPFQYSCLENPRDKGAWWAAIYGVSWSWTWLKQLSSSSSNLCIAKFCLFSLSPWRSILLCAVLFLFLRGGWTCYWTQVQLFAAQKPIIWREVPVEKKGALTRKVDHLDSYPETNLKDPAEPQWFLKGKVRWREESQWIMEAGDLVLHHCLLWADSRLTDSFFRCYLTCRICLQVLRRSLGRKS